MLHVRSANLIEVAAGLPRASDRWDMGAVNARNLRQAFVFMYICTHRSRTWSILYEQSGYNPSGGRTQIAERSAYNGVYTSSGRTQRTITS